MLTLDIMSFAPTNTHQKASPAKPWLALGLATLLGFSEFATAGCSRVINVPIAPVGLSVFVLPDGSVNGVYPEVLRSAASKEGCEFEFSVVPRARLEAMFENGRADMLIPASRSAARDAYGIFVPLVYSRPTLISVRSDRLIIRSAQELVERREVKVGIVRGFDFGAAYQALIQDLTRQGRIVMEVDAASVARLLQSNTIDMTIMAPSILVGAMHADPKAAALIDKLHSQPIDDLPWGDSGAYLSKSGLGEADRNALREILEQSARSGSVWRAFQRFYPANTLTGSIRAR